MYSYIRWLFTKYAERGFFFVEVNADARSCENQSSLRFHRGTPCIRYVFRIMYSPTCLRIIVKYQRYSVGAVVTLCIKKMRHFKVKRVVNLLNPFEFTAHHATVLEPELTSRYWRIITSARRNARIRLYILSAVIVKWALYEYCVCVPMTSIGCFTLPMSNCFLIYLSIGEKEEKRQGRWIPMHCEYLVRIVEQ